MLWARTASRIEGSDKATLCVNNRERRCQGCSSIFGREEIAIMDNT